jgi:ribonuclease G
METPARNRHSYSLHWKILEKKSMKKVVLTKQNNVAVGVVFDRWHQTEEAATELRIFSDSGPDLKIGTILIGHVRDVVKNIEAAFVELDEKTIGYLSVTHASPVFLNRKNTDKICEGDNLIVQIAKEPIKTKDAVLTTNFSLTGRYVVLTHGKSGITFSAKIKDRVWKEHMCGHLADFSELPYGLLLRTESFQADISEILKEIDSLEGQYQNILTLAQTRQKHYVLKEAESELVHFVKDSIKGQQECRLVTDCADIYETLEELTGSGDYPCVSLDFYEDKLLPLYKLYSLERIFHEAYAKKVWLKSGAYLVIEYTEALTVIDVNTGKCEKGKNKGELFYKINREAALEIARQLRIRNLSGIILVDFIDMEKESQITDLIEYMRMLVADDSIKTNIVDVTKLHLMEITRRKTTDRLLYLPELFL